MTDEPVKYASGSQRGSDKNKPRFDLIDFDTLDALQQEAGGSPFSVDSTHDVWVYVPRAVDQSMLIPWSFVDRVNKVMLNGAERYGRDNWKSGIPLSRSFGSLLRHIYQWMRGDTAEDHLAHAACNLIFIMCTEEMVVNKERSADLADIGPVFWKR